MSRQASVARMARAMLMSLALTLVCAAGSGVAVASPPHRAALSLGYGGFTIDEDTAANGGVITLEYERFFSEAMAVRVETGGGYYLADESSYSAHGVVGLSYTLDTLRYLPYVVVGVGAQWFGDERIDPAVGLYVQGGGGLDVRVNKHLAIGAMFRFEAPTVLLRVSYVTLGARVVWRWGR